LNPKENERILDLCASPGSKTTQIVARMNNTGLLIANEVKFGRIKILSANTERCGVMSMLITKRDGVALCKRFKEEGFLFDKILLDAPCSGEGTFRSVPKGLEMWNIKTVENLSKLQKSLIASAIEILKPNGELVYSTCTHAPEENEEVIDFALKNFNVKIEKINLPIKARSGITKWKEKEYLEDVKFSCRIYPQDNDTEGFFIAKIRKVK
jgi:NOL1/NOP2/sun family putative RNA methylase